MGKGSLWSRNVLKFWSGHFEFNAEENSMQKKVHMSAETKNSLCGNRWYLQIPLAAIFVTIQ